MKASRGSISGIGERIYRPLSWLCVIIVLLMQIDQIVAGIIYLPEYKSLTATIGDNVKIAFEFCDSADGGPSCSGASFNLSAPNRLCTAGRQLHGHCLFGTAPADHPAQQDLRDSGWKDCKICELMIYGVKKEDAGQYTVCQTTKCATTTTNISFLEVDDGATTTSSTSKPDSPTPNITPGVSKTTTGTRKATTQDKEEINWVPATGEPGNDSRTGARLSSTVGIPLAVIVLIIAIICGALYFYRKRRSRNRQLDQYHSPTASPLTKGNTTTVNINVNNADGCNIELDGENVSFREDPHAGFDT